MAYFQGNPPPPNKVKSFSLDNFTGGLNNRSNILPDNQATDLMNVNFTTDAVVEKRRGSTGFDALVLTGEVVYVDEYRPYADDDVLIRATATELYFGNVKVMNITGQITGVNFAGKYFFADGLKIYVYGYFPQLASQYQSIIGTPINTYTIMQLTNPPLGYAPLDNTKPRGLEVFDYTNKQVWYEPCTNELNDTYNGGNALPESPHYLVSHNGRIYASGSKIDDDTVFITDINQPYYFPSALPMQLPPNSDSVTGMAVYDNSLVIGRKEDMYVITGNTNRTNMGVAVFELQKINVHTGFASHSAINVANNFLYFLGSDGNAYALNNTLGASSVLNTVLLSQTVDFYNTPVSLSKTSIWTACSIYFEDKWYLSIGDKIMVYSPRHQGWTVYNHLNARSFYKLHGVLVWGDTSGRLTMPSLDYLDYGVPYEAHWTSKNFDMSDPHSYKYFREFFVVAHSFGDYNSDIHFSFFVDYLEVNAYASIKNKLLIWGASSFGDPANRASVNASFPFMIGRRGRSLCFKLWNGFNVSGQVALLADLNTFPDKKEGTLVKVTEDGKYHLFTEYAWVEATTAMLNQPMRIYQINNEYEMRGRR